MKKIIFLDLDGTLWTFEKIPSSALKAIELARKNGHKIYINTGRTRGSLTLAHSQNSQMSFMYGFFFVKFLFSTVVCVVIVT